MTHRAKMPPASTLGPPCVRRFTSERFAQSDKHEQHPWEGLIGKAILGTTFEGLPKNASSGKPRNPHPFAIAFLSEWLSTRSGFGITPKGPPGPIPPKGAEGALGSPWAPLGSLGPLGPPWAPLGPLGSPCPPLGPLGSPWVPLPPFGPLGAPGVPPSPGSQGISLSRSYKTVSRD